MEGRGVERDGGARLQTPPPEGIRSRTARQS
jgi:hypothetical protein